MQSPGTYISSELLRAELLNVYSKEYNMEVIELPLISSVRIPTISRVKGLGAKFSSRNKDIYLLMLIIVFLISRDSI